MGKEKLRIISGSCLLAGEQIQSLNGTIKADDLREMCRVRPTTEVMCLNGIKDFIGQREACIYWWLETKEYAELVKLKTGLSYKTALGIFTEEAVAIQRTLRSPQVFSLFTGNIKMYVLLTDTPYVDSHLQGAAGKYSAEYMDFLRNNHLPLPPSLRRSLSNNPGSVNKLRIAVTYSNEGILGLKVGTLQEKPPVAVELRQWHEDQTNNELIPSKSSTMLFAKQRFGTEFVLIG